MFLGLNLLDLALTCWLIRPGSAELREVNPIAGWCLRGWGWAGLASFKVAMVVLATGLFVVIARYRPGTGVRIVNMSCLAVGLVVVYSGYLIASNGQAVVEMRRQEEKEEQLLQRGQQILADRAVLHGLARDLAARRSTLPEACARWRQYKPDDPVWLRRMHANLGCQSDGACIAIVLMRNAVEAVEKDPTAARRLAGRLAAEFEAQFGSPAPELRLRYTTEAGDGPAPASGLPLGG